MDLMRHLQRQIRWSLQTFGPGTRFKMLMDHIDKEQEELKANPIDLEEWIDLVLLALDGAWRSGHTSKQIADALEAKQAKNEKRQWPDWRNAPLDKAIEHMREES